MDDLIILVEANSLTELEEKANLYLEIIGIWCDKTLLTLAPNKCQALLLKGKTVREVTIATRNAHTKPVKMVRYLGVEIGERFSFSLHVIRVRETTRTILAKVNKIASHQGSKQHSTDHIIQKCFSPYSILCIRCLVKQLKL